MKVLQLAAIVSGAVYAVSAAAFPDGESARVYVYEHLTDLLQATTLSTLMPGPPRPSIPLPCIPSPSADLG
jgi:hypothetical protein